MKKSKAIILYIIAVWLCLALLTGCKTSHTISRAELHRTTEHLQKADSLSTHTAVTDSTYHNISVTDSTVITHIIETIITNTVDANGNIIDTKHQTNLSTNRDHNRIVNDRTSNKHTETNDTTTASNISNIHEHIDSLSNEDVVHKAIMKRSWSEIIMEALYNAFSILTVLCVIATILYLSYKYITGK